MRKIIVFSMLTLDGVIQAPGGPHEDTSNDFKFGGWTAPYADAVYRQIVEKELAPADYLLGRKTFEIWENYWPQNADFWPGINSGIKYVLSNTRENSGWQPSAFVKNIEEIKQLKATDGADLNVWGSSELVQLLLKNDLVDELHLKIHPLLLGKGKKLFDDHAFPAAFKLAESTVTPKGVVIATYLRDEEVITGNLE